jgi:hypothetical protein
MTWHNRAIVESNLAAQFSTPAGCKLPATNMHRNKTDQSRNIEMMDRELHSEADVIVLHHEDYFAPIPLLHLRNFQIDLSPAVFNHA